MSGAAGGAVSGMSVRNALRWMRERVCRPRGAVLESGPIAGCVVARRICEAVVVAVVAHACMDGSEKE